MKWEHLVLLSLVYLDIARSTRVSPEHLEAAVAEALERGLVRRARLKVAIRTLKDKGRRELLELNKVLFAEIRVWEASSTFDRERSGWTV